MVEQTRELPEGTDKVIAGASASEREEELIVAEPTSRTDKESAAGTARGKMMQTVRSGGEKLSGQAADKARGLVGQGLERGSAALGNVSRLVEDTAASLDSQLGEQYGDYARSAATRIGEVADRLASKDPDELIDDTREFVRKSPGVALAGAAVVGFALVRLVQSGLDSDRSSRPAKGKRKG